ncbi:hypothetical protein [Echinimonas agarilytica]|uniref:Uncharacterized protein n=1 Tax=Echinimonas agarilytica TaxID=1215918 RepID=A0AA41W595_9GAMM|nr:hypothetical protein [Echinimonas agarilytica]MCM2679156.1 hypothetical protein [Echinimonas agarilytica]
MIQCCSCADEAKYIVVNGSHDIVGDVYCAEHAFEDAREKCPGCDDYALEVYDDKTGDILKFLPVYQLGCLDGNGYCSDHP